MTRLPSDDSINKQLEENRKEIDADDPSQRKRLQRAMKNMFARIVVNILRRFLPLTQRHCGTYKKSLRKPDNNTTIRNITKHVGCEFKLPFGQLHKAVNKDTCLHLPNRSAGIILEIYADEEERQFGLVKLGTT